MNLKSYVIAVVRKSAWLRKARLLLTNQLALGSNALQVSSIHFSKNDVHITGQKNEISCQGEAFLRNCRVLITGNNNRIVMEEDAQVYGEEALTFHISGNDNLVFIGAHSLIRSTSFFIHGDRNEIRLGENISTMMAEYHIEQNDNHLQIMNGCTFHGRNGYPIHIALDEGSSVMIGEDCMLSNGIQIRSTDSHSIVNEDGKRINPAEDVVIGRHCWLGLGCILLKGVHIPENTVVAAGAVCTRKYETGNCILAGNPAKPVKQGTNWDRKFL